MASDFVTVRFELVQPNPAGGDNNFVVRLDSYDPVHTSETEYTFTGMRPGQHILTITEVDANGTPLPERSATVQFTVKPPTGTMHPAQNGGGQAAPAK
jgi:hypothetical protein